MLRVCGSVSAVVDSSEPGWPTPEMLSNWCRQASRHVDRHLAPTACVVQQKALTAQVMAKTAQLDAATPGCQSGHRKLHTKHPPVCPYACQWHGRALVGHRTCLGVVGACAHQLLVPQLQQCGSTRHQRCDEHAWRQPGQVWCSLHGATTATDHAKEADATFIKHDRVPITPWLAGQQNSEEGTRCAPTSDGRDAGTDRLGRSDCCTSRLHTQCTEGTAVATNACQPCPLLRPMLVLRSAT